MKDNLSHENPVFGKILSEVHGSKACYPEEKYDDNLKKVIKESHAELCSQAFGRDSTKLVCIVCM